MVIVDVQEKLVVKKNSVELMNCDSLQGGSNGQEIHHAKPTRVVYKISVDSLNHFKKELNQYAVHPC